MKVLLLANTDWYLYNFRLSLIKSLRDKGYEVVLLSPSGPYGKALQDLGFRWIAAPMDRLSLNPVSEARLLFWITRLLKRERVDLVHGFTIKCAVYVSIAARLAGVRARVSAVAGMGYVFTSQDLKARLLRPWVRLLMRLALNSPQSRLILQNPDDVGIFLRSGLVEEDRIRLIHGSGVDCDRFAPKHGSAESRVRAGAEPVVDGAQVDRIGKVNEISGSDEVAEVKKELGVSSIGGTGGSFQVLLPARLLWDKGIQEFIDAARIVKGFDHAGEFEFLLAGDPDPGNPASVPVDVVKGWVSEGLVQWLGHVDDMPALFNSVDVVVLPSYREGLPKGLIEAAACARPLITTDVPGCREVVTNEKDGLLVPAQDADALARAILRLANNPVLRHAIGQAARIKAVEQFDERIVIEKTLSVYRELGG